MGERARTPVRIRPQWAEAGGGAAAAGPHHSGRVLAAHAEVGRGVGVRGSHPGPCQRCRQASSSSEQPLPSFSTLPVIKLQEFTICLLSTNTCQRCHSALLSDVYRTGVQAANIGGSRSFHGWAWGSPLSWPGGVGQGEPSRFPAAASPTCLLPPWLGAMPRSLLIFVMDGLSHTWQEDRAFPGSESWAAAPPPRPRFALYTKAVSQRRGARTEPHMGSRPPGEGGLQAPPLRVLAMGPLNLSEPQFLHL